MCIYLRGGGMGVTVCMLGRWGCAVSSGDVPKTCECLGQQFPVTPACPGYSLAFSPICRPTLQNSWPVCMCKTDGMLFFIWFSDYGTEKKLNLSSLQGG